MKLKPVKKISLSELRTKADAGDVEAQSALGLFYEIGIEVPKADIKEAAKWWGKAAKAGDATAQFSLAELLTNEFEDTEENRAMAQALYKKAEDGGFVRADKALRMLERDRGRGWSALVVDDSSTTRISVKAFLEAEGCDVVEAADSQEAMQKMHKYPEIRIVFTDLKTPVMAGFDFIKSLRAIPKFAQTPVVVMSSENSPEIVTRGKKLQITGWIVKPIRPQMIRRYLNKIGSQLAKANSKKAS